MPVVGDDHQSLVVESEAGCLRDFRCEPPLRISVDQKSLNDMRKRLNPETFTCDVDIEVTDGDLASLQECQKPFGQPPRR